MKKIRLLDIIITEAFANSHPSDEKVQKYRVEKLKECPTDLRVKKVAKCNIK